MMTKRWRALAAPAAALLLVVLSFTAVPLAQQDDGFVTMTPEMMAQAQEQLPAGPLVFTAYAVAWVVMLGYVLVLWRKQGRLERELRQVQAELGTGRK